MFNKSIAVNLISSACALALVGPAASQDTATSFERVPAEFFDRLAYDEPGDGQLWVLGRDYKASFGPDGATFVPFLGSDAPRTYPVHMRLEEASLGGEALVLKDAAQYERNGDSVTLSRGSKPAFAMFSLSSSV